MPYLVVEALQSANHLLHPLLLFRGLGLAVLEKVQHINRLGHVTPNISLQFGGGGGGLKNKT